MKAARLPSFRLAGKRIWVTGGAGHLGTPVIEALVRTGANTVCIDLAGRADALVASPGLKQTVPVSLDMCDTHSLETGLAALIAAHGVPDGLVHLAC